MDCFNFSSDDTDVFLYVGEINRQGYLELSNAISSISEDKRKSKTLLCLATLGGDPDAGYRIGRCLQHYYEKQVTLFAPSLCKSSGTLTAIAANNLIIGNQGELGPLDIQLRKTDEIGEQSSGLDIFKAVNFLEDRVMEQFSRYLPTIRFGSGVSTRLSADIAAKLVQSVIEPIANQIDPIKIGEHQRAIGIAQKYGDLLNEMTQSLKQNSLSILIAGYPSHGFVIDRKEAAKLFNNVYKPCDTLCSLFSFPIFSDFNILGQNQPIVFKYEITDPAQEDQKNESEFTESTKPKDPDDGERPREPSNSTGTKSSTERSNKKRVGNSSSSI
ncbi:SDH family Clp fold serine proteinase [Neisseria dumasiana]|uniref:SDH family Clp fold serine proteinase n=1 Tax=Neisseria dumasiana TaxID=1931275 RepID=UPI000F7A9E1D|nr:SppA protein [Neisseria dumasiana]